MSDKTTHIQEEYEAINWTWTDLSPRSGCSTIPYYYQRDPAEEAWHSSPAGLRAAAKERRVWAARLIAEADEMEARANGT